MTTEATKFLFDTVFEKDLPPPEEDVAPVQPEEQLLYTEADLETAKSRAHQEGVAAGLEQARGEVQRLATQALDEIAGKLAEIQAQIDNQRQEAHKQTVELGYQIAKKLANALIEREPLVEVEAMISESLRELSEQTSEPRVVIWVAEALVAELSQHANTLAARSGFSGQIVALGDPDLTGSDCRVEWADGGAERDGTQLEQAVEAAVARYLQGNGAAPDLIREATHEDTATASDEVMPEAPPVTETEDTNAGPDRTETETEATAPTGAIEDQIPPTATGVEAENNERAHAETAAADTPPVAGDSERGDAHDMGGKDASGQGAFEEVPVTDAEPAAPDTGTAGPTTDTDIENGGDEAPSAEPDDADNGETEDREPRSNTEE